MSERDTDPEPLNLYDQDEWWDVARIVRPDLTREEFDAMWAEFCEAKQRRALS